MTAIYNFENWKFKSTDKLPERYSVNVYDQSSGKKLIDGFKRLSGEKHLDEGTYKIELYYHDINGNDILVGIAEKVNPKKQWGCLFVGVTKKEDPITNNYPPGTIITGIASGGKCNDLHDVHLLCVPIPEPIIGTPAFQINNPQPLTEAHLTHAPSDNTEPELIKEYPIFAAYVHDSKYPKEELKVKEEAYYILKREQFYRRYFYKVFNGLVEETVEITCVNGTKTTNAKSLKSILNISVTGTISASYGPVAAELTTSISHSLELSSQTVKSKETLETLKTTKTYPTMKSSYVIADWEIVDRFTLKRKNDDVVRTWEIDYGHQKYSSSYPKHINNISV